MSADPPHPSPPDAPDAAADPLQQARLLLQQQRLPEAEPLVREALEREPERAACWSLLGRLLELKGDLGEAAQVLLQAASLDPSDVDCRTALGHLFRTMSLPEEAIHWYGEALALEPDQLVLHLNHLFVLPIVPISSGQIEQLRQRCLEGLQPLLRRNGAGELHLGSQAMTHHPYYLIYHNRDDRPVLEAYGQLLQPHVQALAASLPSAGSGGRRGAGGEGRRRIGFLSGFFDFHSNSLAFEGLIRHLDRRRFEVFVIHLASTRLDQMRERIDACADRSLVLPAHLPKALAQLAALDLDLLYFTDIGMHPTATLLACARSAPLQVTGWGVPQTSGLATIDHYISSALAEPPQADAYYSEQLVRLPDMPCCYLSENLCRQSRSRDYFFLPLDVPLLGCLQSLWKLHPDFDAVLERLAQRLPQAWFVFIEARVTTYTDIFLQRLAITAPTLRERMVLLSYQSREDYIALAGCLDLLLDPPYFGSGVTFYDTIHSGTPTLSLEGPFLRSRVVGAAYRLMGLERPPLVSDVRAYEEEAVRLISDPPALERLRREIRRHAHRLYDRREGVEAFADFALGAIEEARARTDR